MEWRFVRERSSLSSKSFVVDAFIGVERIVFDFLKLQLVGGVRTKHKTLVPRRWFLCSYLTRQTTLTSRR